MRLQDIMKLTTFLSATFAALWLTSSVYAQSSGFKGTVLETMSAANYTYAEIDTGKAKLWIAGPQTKIKKGDTINTPVGFEMKDFKSPSLKRTFPSIFFVGEINTGEGNVKQALPPGHPPTNPNNSHPGVADAIDAHGLGKKIPSPIKNFEGITKAPDGLTVQELLDKAGDLGGKTVRFRARIVKVNKHIMGRNWYHLQDGTGKGTNADITVTSSEAAALGDVVLVEGTVALNRDFGLGYKYPVMVEKAKLAIEKE